MVAAFRQPLRQTLALAACFASYAFARAARALWRDPEPEPISEPAERRHIEPLARRDCSARHHRV